MGLLARALAPMVSASDGPGGPLSDYWYQPRGTLTSSGVSVTPETALNIATWNACLRILSNTLAMLPLVTYRRTADDGKDRATNHPLYAVLHDRPNTLQTSFQFRQGQMRDLVSRGNAYARILSGPRGTVDQLVPLSPDRMQVEAISNGRRRYTYHPPGGGAQQTLTQDEVWHLMNMSQDGLIGTSLIAQARESLGMAAAVSSYGARLFSQGALHQGVLSHPGTLKPETRERLRDELSSQHSGLANAHKTMILQEGMKWEKTSLTPEDAQWLGTRTFQSAEIAEWTGVPLELLQLEGRTTTWGTGIEQLLIGFITFTMNPWFVLWEQSINTDLITARDTFFAEFRREALLRGDAASRANFYNTMVNMGSLTRNEVRRLENLNILPGLDEPLTPLNMRQGQEQSAPSPKQMPPPEPPPARRADSVTPHYRALVLDAAARMVRRETQALAKLAAKHAADSQAFHVAAATFYADHAGAMAEALRISDVDAADWCDCQRHALAQDGLGQIEHWNESKPRDLAMMVLGMEER